MPTFVVTDQRRSTICLYNFNGSLSSTDDDNSEAQFYPHELTYFREAFTRIINYLSYCLSQVNEPRSWRQCKNLHLSTARGLFPMKAGWQDNHGNCYFNGMLFTVMEESTDKLPVPGVLTCYSYFGQCIRVKKHSFEQPYTKTALD